MSPLSLLDCPKEVQLGIAEFLSQADLANLSMACRALHRLAEPLVYSSVKFMWTRELYPPITQLLQLLRTLLERSDLRPLIRNAEFGGFGYVDRFASEPDPPLTIPALPVSQLSANLERAGVSQLVANDWKSEVQSGASEAVVAVIVSLLPNVERLCLSANWTNDTKFLGLMLRAALCDRPQHKENTDLPSFTSLKHVSLEMMIDEDRLLDPSNTADALALFYLPNIETLSVSIDNPTNFSWPSPSPPSPTSLQSLEIFRLRESRIAPILSSTTNLKKLRYNWLYRSDLDDEVSTDVVMLDTMANALLEVKDSLEELEIIAERALATTRGEIELPDVTFQGSMNKLRGMHRLRTLRVPWALLTGMHGASTGPGHLGAAVPDNIEHLALYCGFMQQEDYEYEGDHDQLMIDSFEEELESVPGAIKSRHDDGKHVLAVDFTTFKTSDLQDCIHPTNDGYKIMSDYWYSFIHQIPSSWIKKPVGPDPDIPAPDWGKSPIQVTSKKTVADAAEYATGGEDKYVKCNGNPWYKGTGKNAQGNVGKNGDWKYHKNWVSEVQVAEGLGLDNRYVRLHDTNGDGKADYAWIHPKTGEITCWLNNLPKPWSKAGNSNGIIGSGAGPAKTIYLAVSLFTKSMTNVTDGIQDMNGDGMDDYLVVDPDKSKKKHRITVVRNVDSQDDGWYVLEKPLDRDWACGYCFDPKTHVAPRGSNANPKMPSSLLGWSLSTSCMAIRAFI
ncbi:hypothetical protein IL306_007863 [Fusarium sp. DS 682]|nr:hypothetical protein IL306_007863 [Fusarium sp. DS 682]